MDGGEISASVFSSLEALLVGGGGGIDPTNQEQLFTSTDLLCSGNRLRAS